MTTLFGAIADDFTGATDLAGLLARSGVHVSLRFGIPPEPATSSAPVEIIALKCRTSPVDEAVAEVLAALEWLKGAGAQRFYWKYCSTFDSTPQGNIGPVAEALMKALGTDRTIYCPAFPENGRSVFMGNLFVGEQPLAESPMKDHPLTPMRDSNLIRLLSPQVSGKVGLINRLAVARGAEKVRSRFEELTAGGIEHVVVDAVADDDLTTIAEAFQDLPLITGGSALASPLPHIWQRLGLLEAGGAEHHGRAGDGQSIILSGSCSAMTNRQVKHYLRRGQPAYRLDPIALAERGPSGALLWLSAQPRDSTPIIYATAEPAAVRTAQKELGVERAGELVEYALGRCAVAALERGFRQFVVAGGETSGTVAKALGVTRVDVGAEITPGVPWCYAESAGQPVAIALKSGNFGTETFFTDALEMLGR